MVEAIIVTVMTKKWSRSTGTANVEAGSGRKSR